VVLLQLQRLPEAEGEAKAAVIADAKSARAHDLLGQIFVQRRQLTPARAEFEAALRIDPEFGPAQLDLAETLIDQGQARAAADLLEKSTRSRSPEIAQRAHAMLQELNQRK
jgi:tetratricopeptide (TPR) repeat protein